MVTSDGPFGIHLHDNPCTGQVLGIMIVVKLTDIAVPNQKPCAGLSCLDAPCYKIEVVRVVGRVATVIRIWVVASTWTPPSRLKSFGDQILTRTRDSLDTLATSVMLVY